MRCLPLIDKTGDEANSDRAEDICHQRQDRENRPDRDQTDGVSPHGAQRPAERDIQKAHHIVVLYFDSKILIQRHALRREAEIALPDLHAFFLRRIYRRLDFLVVGAAVNDLEAGIVVDKVGQ